MTIGLVWISWDNLETKRIPLSTIMSLGEKEHRNPESSSAETLPPIQQPWARLTESVEPKFTQSQPTDELDTEIREAQAQLANPIQQRWLLGLQQEIFDEQVALEVARNRLAATSKDRSPIVRKIHITGYSLRRFKTVIAKLVLFKLLAVLLLHRLSRLSVPLSPRPSLNFHPLNLRIPL